MYSSVSHFRRLALRWSKRYSLPTKHKHRERARLEHHMRHHDHRNAATHDTTGRASPTRTAPPARSERRSCPTVGRGSHCRTSRLGKWGRLTCRRQGSLGFANGRDKGSRLPCCRSVTLACNAGTIPSIEDLQAWPELLRKTAKLSLYFLGISSAKRSRSNECGFVIITLWSPRSPVDEDLGLWVDAFGARCFLNNIRLARHRALVHPVLLRVAPIIVDQTEAT